MDTSETYIKMSDFPRIQTGHEWDEGDVFVAVGEPSVFGGVSDNIYVVGDASAPHCSKGVWWSDCLVSEAGDFHFKDCIWLPRQDQLQEMVKADIGELFSMFVTFCGGIEQGVVWLRLQYCDYSMEQLWLAFVMKEKYNKTWDGEKWYA